MFWHLPCFTECSANPFLNLFFFFYHSYNCKMFIIIKALAPCIFFTPQLFLTISLGSFLFGHTRTSQLEAWPYSQALFLGSLQTFLDYLGSTLNRGASIFLCITQFLLHTAAPSIIPKLLPASCIRAQVKSKQGSASLYSCKVLPLVLVQLVNLWRNIYQYPLSITRSDILLSSTDTYQNPKGRETEL